MRTQPYLSVLFQAYLSDSLLTFAVQREGEGKVSTISWNQSQQIVRQRCTMLRLPSPFAAGGTTLLPWPLYPSNTHKNHCCLISLSCLPLTSVSSNTEANLKKNPRPVSVCLSYIKGNPTLGNQKEGFHVSKTIHIFKGGPQLTYNRSKPIESSACSFFFSPCCELESWGSLIISLNSAPKKAILFTQLRNPDAKHPRLFFRHTQTRSHHQTLPNDCLSQTRKTAIKW